MKCPSCKKDNISTIDTRQVEQRNSVRRRKKCQDCEHKWTTFEINDNLLCYYEALTKKYKEFVEMRFTAIKVGGASKKWTTSEDDRLIALYYQGLSYSQIAETLERTYKSIELRVMRLRKAKKI